MDRGSAELASGKQDADLLFPSPSGALSSPFAGAFDAPELEAPRARLAEHFDSEAELEAVLNDADALITALSDYIWSLGKTR